MAETTSILVLGAAELGTAVAEALASHPQRNGARISISMRPSSVNSPSPSKKALLERWHHIQVKPVGLDIETQSSSGLAKVFSKYSAVVGCTGMAGSPNLQMKLAEAVIEARTARYIPWQFGVDYDVIGAEAAGGLFASQCQVRHKLRNQQHTGWVIVSTGVFMSFLFQPLFGVVESSEQHHEVRAFGKWDNSITATTVEDIGRCTAEVLFNSPEMWHSSSGNGHVVFVAGDTVTFDQLASVVKKVTGPSVRRQLWTTEELKRKVAEDPSNGINKYRVIWAENRGVAWDVSRSFNARKDIKMTTVEDYLNRNTETTGGLAKTFKHLLGGHSHQA